MKYFRPLFKDAFCKIVSAWKLGGRWGEGGGGEVKGGAGGRGEK
jgi:hypothetical protein